MTTRAGESAGLPRPADVQTAGPDLALARKVLEVEASAILGLMDRLDHRFTATVRLLLECRGRVILTGMGKSGLICRKIAATLSSTGTPAFFLHPAEAIHGDLGVITGDDVVLALSYSGETGEILRLLEAIKRLGARLVVLTGDCESTLGKAADVALDYHVSEEACPMNLVPTASTTAALALGDALAMSLLVAKGFRAEDFASLHPGGKIGKRLMRVRQLMHGGSDAPIVRTSTAMKDVIYEMNSKKLGMTCVVAPDDRLVGIITDGDLRRRMSDSLRIVEGTAGEIMTHNPITVTGEMFAVEALKLMEERKITAVVVVDPAGGVEGVVHLHALWRTGMV